MAPVGAGVDRACPRHAGTAEQAWRPDGDDHRRLCRVACRRHQERRCGGHRHRWSFDGGMTLPGVVTKLGASRVREMIFAAFLPPEGTSIVESSPWLIARVARRGMPDDIARTWILTLRDRALSPKLQRKYIESLGGVDPGQARLERRGYATAGSVSTFTTAGSPASKARSSAPRSSVGVDTSSPWPPSAVTTSS
jgi:hypothetical protein